MKRSLLMGEVLGEKAGEVLLGVGDDPGEGLEDLLGGELHDLAAEVDDPDDLLVVGEYLFAKLQ